MSKIKQLAVDIAESIGEDEPVVVDEVVAEESDDD